uniref:Uncharacterized protein n=1 Tax=Siphoviridae sp. ctzyE57 TaxID=2827982 RepID=A0A8S5SGL2_9CAUD|nr:MAG TPA: hypothetical protein [Siphoviridae sp. ctzyE57]
MYMENARRSDGLVAKQITALETKQTRYDDWKIGKTRSA